MPNLVCVYKSGGDYSAEYVSRLMAGFRRHNPGGDWKTVCLTDRQEEVAAVHNLPDSILKLRNNWPGWWAKMEMFSIPPPCLYLDLDTVVLGNLEDAFGAHDSTLLGLRDFGVPSRFETGVMAWKTNLEGIVDEFRDDVSRGTWMRNHLVVFGVDYPGDGAWLRDYIIREHVSTGWIQLYLSGIASYKYDVAGKELPQTAKLVCFHGLPRPGQVQNNLKWLVENWGGSLK